MRVEKIAEHEARFDASGVDSHGRRHGMLQKSIAVPDGGEVMYYVDAGLADGDESFFYRTRFAKDQIVLHFTMGYLGGDIATLTQPDYHVSVPFVLGRNGTIYNLFPSFYWSYHLGRGALGGNQVRSRHTIGIEISNIGPLVPRSGALNTTYGDRYCLRDQTEHHVAASYRGYDHYATFTDAQYTALITLLRYLTARYGIARRFLPEPDRYAADRGVVDLGGIVSHVNYRPTGKTDIGPAFDWDRVIAGVTDAPIA
jgi:N-acetyl-anhydromuramyl-L-alanine amidase AmpD